jgi:predicted ATP-dependent endonuclease of OLD family
MNSQVNKGKYDEVSPITNNFCVLVDIDEETTLVSKICMESGYVTNSYLMNNSEVLEKLQSSIAKVAFDFKIIDTFGYIWIPCMQASENSSIYPIPDTNKKLSEEDSKKYPDPNNEGKFLESYIDFENSVEFPKDNFVDAFKHFAKAV